MDKSYKVIVVSIINFDPLNVVFPNVDTYTGKLRLELPAVHVKLCDLSMDGLIPGGPYIGGDGQIFGLDINLGEKTLTAGQMMELIQKSRLELSEMHRIIQQTLDEHGALL